VLFACFCLNSHLCPARIFGACFQIAPGARVCDAKPRFGPQQRRPFKKSRISGEASPSTPLSLHDNICKTSDQIWLAAIVSLRDSLPVNFNGQLSDRSTSWLTTAQYSGESTDQFGSGDLSRTNYLSRLAEFFVIPVGYQDESGFHHGEQQVEKTVPTFEPEMVGDN
jgi:hypothetical protein